MMLMIKLPREGDGCNPNRGRCLHRFRQAADAKHARTVGRLYAQQAMQDAELRPGAFTPRVALLETYWSGHDLDVDNAAACIKAYQDGIFDALGANDRELQAILSVKFHTDVKQMHRCKTLLLFDNAAEAAAHFARRTADALAAADARNKRRCRKATKQKGEGTPWLIG